MAHINHDDEPDRTRQARKQQASERESAVRRKLHDLQQKLSVALDGSSICLFTQDLSLRYVWVANPPEGFDASTLIDRSDTELFDAETAAVLMDVKQSVLDTGIGRTADVSIEWEGEKRHFSLKAEPYLSDDDTCLGLIGTAVETTEQNRREEQLRRALLEMSHRTRNQMATLLSVVRRAAPLSTSKDDFQHRVEARTQALARIQDLLVDAAWGPVDLEKLIATQMALCVNDLSRVSLSGPPVKLEPEAAQALGFALHELALNASRYGSLTKSDGKLSVVWSHESVAPHDVILRWSETGGPTVQAPETVGLGRSIIENALAASLGAPVAMDFRASGLRCVIRIPRRILK